MELSNQQNQQTQIEYLDPTSQTFDISSPIKLDTGQPDQPDQPDPDQSSEYNSMREDVLEQLGDSLETIYELSYTDSETHRIDMVVKIADEVECNVVKIDTVKGKKNNIVSLLIRKRNELNLDLKVAMSGSVDSGKSTLIGVLTNGILDNGRGLARSGIYQFKHELELGKTSSVNQYIMGFTGKGGIANNLYKSRKKKDWGIIVNNSVKVITFYDLAGHEKYLKTTIFGLTGNQPDYAIIMVGSNMGVTRITREHMGLCIALKIPFIVVLTKVDICPDHIYENTFKTVRNLLKLPGVRKLPYLIKDKNDVLNAIKNSNNIRVAPIFNVSNVTGLNIDLLKLYLNLLPIKIRKREDLKKSSIRYYVNDTFTVKGVGTVVSGLLKYGEINVDQEIFIGPFSNGKFKKTTIKSIECKKNPTTKVEGCKNACLSIRKVSKNELRKGMVILDKDDDAFWYFEAEILILNTHSTTITQKYEPVIHINNIKETCNIVAITDINDDSMVANIKQGRKFKMTFRFKFRPYFVEAGDKVIIRDDRTKAIGTITATFNSNEPFRKRYTSAKRELRKEKRKVRRINQKKKKQVARTVSEKQ
jgi:GTPase